MRDVSYAYARVATRPPKPRPSQSPALKDRVVSPLDETPVKDNQTVTECPNGTLLVSETLDGLKDVPLEVVDETDEQVVDAFNHYSPGHLSPEEGDQVDHLKPRHLSTNLGLPHNHPFLIPTKQSPATKEVLKGFKNPETPDPPMDILAQWRLRRKLEAEQRNADSRFSDKTFLTRPMMHDGVNYDESISNVSSRKPQDFHRGSPTDYRVEKIHLFSSATQTSKLDTRHASTMTSISPKHYTDQSCSVNLKPEGRSVRLMVKPSRYTVGTQTLSSSVECDPGPHPRPQPDPLEDDCCSDTDSWQWTHVTSEWTESPHNLQAIASTPIKQPPVSPIMSEGNQVKPTTRTPASIDGHIVQYLEQPTDIRQLIGPWKDDPIIQDLLLKRSVCLEKLSSVLVELRRRDLNAALAIRTRMMSS